MRVDEVLDRVRRLKQSAKTHVRFEAYSEALDDLQRAISLLEEAGGEWLDPTSPTPEPPAGLERAYELADELADCLGMQGGTLRRQGGIAQALASYTAGSRFELDEKFGVMKSYNTVNALKMALLGETAIASDRIPSVDEAIELISKQVAGARRMDRWAWADLGDCYLLKGGSGDEALTAYGRFIQLADDESVESAHQVLGKLAEELSSREDSRAAAVQRVVDLLAEELEAL